MSTVLEPKKFASLMADDAFSFTGRDPWYPARGGGGTARPSSPSPSSRFSLRRSSYSSRSGSIAQELLDSPPATSCVTREMAANDCATQRFLVWVAVRRNDCKRMPESARLQCPLNRCSRRFPDHESMLRHVLTCDRLAYCEYWCYDHDGVERFDDSRCKKCLTHPSKRRRMLSMAKGFFTSLGHAGGKGKAPADPAWSRALSSFSPAPSFVSPLSSPGHMECGSECLARSASYGSTSSYHSSSRYCHPDDMLDVPAARSASSGRPSAAASSSSAQGSPFLHAFGMPPPPYEDVSGRGCAELQSNEISEIDSRELTEMPRPTSQPPPVLGPVPRPLASDSVLRADLFGDLTADPVSCHASAPPSPPKPSEAHPMPPPACPSPPTSPPTLFANAASDGAPVDLWQWPLSELDSKAVAQPNCMDWEPSSSALASAPSPVSAFLGIDNTLSAILGMGNGESSEAASFNPYLAFQEGDDAALFDMASQANLRRPSLQLSMQSLELFSLETETAPAPPRPESSRPPRPVSTAPRSKNLSPSSSVRSTTSTTSTVSTMSASSVMSAVSDASSASSASSDCCLASTIPWVADRRAAPSPPVDECLGLSDFIDDSIFAAEDNGISGQLHQSASPTSLSSPVSDMSSSSSSSPFSFLPAVYGGIAPLDMDSLPPEDLLLTLDQPLDAAPLSATTSVPSSPVDAVYTDVDVGVDAAAVATTADGAEDRSDDLSGALEFASSAHVLMQTHVMLSLIKLRDMDSAKNSLVFVFQTATPRQIMDTGIQALQKALAKPSEPMTPFETLCFLHVIYAFSILTYKSDVVLRSSALFAQSLTYARNFGFLERDHYLEIVSRIWKPGDMTAAELSDSIRMSQSPATIDDMPFTLDDIVISTAKAFLDDLETWVVLDPVAPASKMMRASQLFALHFGHRDKTRSSPAFAASLGTILDALFRNFAHVAGLRTRLKAIGRHWKDGAPDNVRRLELELLHAGKASLGASRTYFDSFVPQTRRLCDPIYAAHNKEAPAAQRAAYYDAGLFLLRTVFDACESDNVQLSPLDMPPQDGEATEQQPTRLTEVAVAPVTPPDSEASAESVAEEAGAAAETAADTAADTAEVDSWAGAVDAPAVADGTEGGDADAAQAEPATKKKVEVEAKECCKICGYRPKGDPRWFRGSMAKHTQNKHSGEDIDYVCPYPGCNSRFHNRLDNLVQHQKRNNHFVGDEVPAKKPRKHKRAPASQGSVGDGENQAPAAKKRKTKRDGEAEGL